MWKVSFKTAVCANTPCPTLTMSWLREVEAANSVDDLVTSKSIEGRDFPDFAKLDAKIASTLRKIISNSNFGRRVQQSSELLMQRTTYQIFSISTNPVTTLRFSISDGTKLC